MRDAFWKLTTATLMIIALVLGGCGSTEKPPAQPPGSEPTQTLPITNPGDDPKGSQSPEPNDKPEPNLPQVPTLPGDMEALREALGVNSPVTYTIIRADAPKGADITRHLDQLLDERGYPAMNEVLLVIFPNDNHNIRFAMGGMLFDKKISLQAMLEMVQNQYLTKARNGDPARGLADLINAINQQVQ